LEEEMTVGEGRGGQQMRLAFKCKSKTALKIPHKKTGALVNGAGY
jgi:hypothetical protein